MNSNKNMIVIDGYLSDMSGKALVVGQADKGGPVYLQVKSALISFLSHFRANGMMEAQRAYDLAYKIKKAEGEMLELEQNEFDLLEQVVNQNAPQFIALVLAQIRKALYPDQFPDWKWATIPQTVKGG